MSDTPIRISDTLHLVDLLSQGHGENTWSKQKLPYKYPWIIQTTGPDSVSKPCWEDLKASAVTYSLKTVGVNQADLHGIILPFEMPKQIEVWTFFYEDFELASKMALKVQKSAMNKRKNGKRRSRLKSAGGFYDQEVIHKLFEIQEGKCYYSGEALITNPKNYDLDHLVPVCEGGSNWPENLALVLTHVNKKKGSNRWGDNEIINWLVERKGEKWAESQLIFMDEVDRKRKRLDASVRERLSLKA